MTFNGKVVADTKRALVLQEAAYKPVFYIPREDAQMALFERTTNSTHCPYKGDASYYTIKVGDRAAENAIWSYETPFPAMKEIEGHLAFYPNRVDAIEVDAGVSAQTVYPPLRQCVMAAACPGHPRLALMPRSAWHARHEAGHDADERGDRHAHLRKTQRRRSAPRRRSARHESEHDVPQHRAGHRRAAVSRPMPRSMRCPTKSPR